MFKKLIQPATAPFSINLSLLILRISVGAIMIPHGWKKLENFSEIAPDFMQFMGLSGPISLALAIFAELICSVFLILGLGTRFIAVPLAITMMMAAFVAHAGDPFSKKEHAVMFLLTYVVILIAGPGKYSADQKIVRN